MRAASLVWVGLTIGALTSAAGAQQEAAAPATSQQRGANQAVYLIKGLAGFQSGIDVMAERLQRRGIAPRIFTHSDPDGATNDIVKRYRAGLRAPVIIVGYSLGADAAGLIARQLHQHRVPVALLILFGPVADVPVTPNVARAINHYQSTSAWRGRMVPAAGARGGSLRNLDHDKEPDINHLTIVRAERYQQQTISNISALVNGARKPAEPKPAGQAAAGEATPPAAGESEPARSN
jgi:pimeloyl-ACP methyl ester carboxylesterase